MLRQADIGRLGSGLAPRYRRMCDGSTVSLRFTDMDGGEGLQKSKDIQQPEDDGDNDDCIEDGLNGTRHWDVAIHQPQKDPDYNQGDYNLN